MEAVGQCLGHVCGLLGELASEGDEMEGCLGEFVGGVARPLFDLLLRNATLG